MQLLVVSALAVAALAAFIDWKTGFIPNTLTLGALLVGLVEQALVGTLPTGLGGAALAAVVPIVLHRSGALGGGDVKLFVALGAFLGPVLGLEAQLLAFLCGMGLVIVRLARAGSLSSTVRRSADVAVNLVLPASKRRPIDESALTWVRFGPAIFAGTLWAVLRP